MRHNRKMFLFSLIMGILCMCLFFTLFDFSGEMAVAEILTNVCDKGGSIYLSGGATFNMTNGTIKGSSADKGGAIYIGNGSVFTMTSGTISSSEANYGGAIYVASGGECYLNGGTITGCSSRVSGNAIYVEEGGYLEIKEGFVIENCGANYSFSINAVNSLNVKRPITVTPYVNETAGTTIKTFSNVALSTIGLPSQEGCGWYEESAYTNKVNTSNLVGTYAETDALDLYFPSHNYGGWVTITAATCNATGSQQKICSICQDIKTQSIAKDSSNHGSNGTYSGVITASTCITKGSQGTYCSGCNALKSTSEIALNSSNHEKTTTHQSVIKAATCTATGTMGYYYDCCNALKSSESYGPNGHTAGSWYYSGESNCTSSYYIYQACSVCGTAVAYQGYGSHSWDSGTVTQSGTCVSAGVKSYSCTNPYCTATTTSSTSTDPNNHVGPIDTTTQPNSCTSAGFTQQSCRACSTVIYYEIGRVLGHDFTMTKTVNEATCISTGLLAVCCTRCGETNGNTVTTPKNPNNHIVPIQVTEYTPIQTATCKTQGTEACYYKCCYAEYDWRYTGYADHSWDSGVWMVEGTCMKAGKKCYTCTVCGTSKNENEFGPHKWVNNACTVCKIAKLFNPTCDSEACFEQEIELMSILPNVTRKETAIIKEEASDFDIKAWLDEIA